ncbi:MAG: SIS domain-containing protein [Verrucomicrobia bacterium]|nr:SIS domain-containing protein [Verrucomicrobiota bacterium]MBS0636134.1 SIS domain-containing protein [Verrucomicrobiota bacterium]
MYRVELEKSLDDAMRAIEQLKDEHNMLFIQQVAHLIATCFTQGNKLILAGNGGSLCDASHFAEELTGLFREKRKALPAIVLSEPGHITCTANDIGFDSVFSRGVEAFGKPGDVFIGLTTSGNSPNIVKAVTRAKELGLHTVAFLGKEGGALKGVADLELIIGGFRYSDRIQEAHMAAIHIIIELMELELFAAKPAEKYELLL